MEENLRKKELIGNLKAWVQVLDTLRGRALTLCSCTGERRNLQLRAGKLLAIPRERSLPPCTLMSSSLYPLDCTQEHFRFLKYTPY